MAGKRCIFLAGAPDGDRLCWDEPALLSSCVFDAPIERFLSASTRIDLKTIETPLPSTSIPKWRSVAFHEADIEVSWPAQEPNLYPDGHASAIGLAHPDFLEHSIAVLEHLDSSQIISSEVANGLEPEEDNEATFVSFNTATTVTDTSMDSGVDVLDAPSTTQDPSLLLAKIKFTGEITDLNRIPKAEHIVRMQPQTITVNLLVGIIAISPARRVQLRRRKLERDIVEVTVGDETRAGFSISFWLAPEEGRERPADDLQQTLRRLRSGHVLLLQSVALSSFRGSVYGQSLSKRFARNSTTLVALGNGAAHGLPDPTASKLQRVREWTSDFVGTVRQPSRHTPGERNEMQERDALPPDTQDE